MVSIFYYFALARTRLSPHSGFWLIVLRGTKQLNFHSMGLFSETISGQLCTVLSFLKKKIKKRNGHQLSNSCLGGLCPLMVYSRFLPGVVNFPAVCFFYFIFLHTTYNSHIILAFTLHYSSLHYLKQPLLTIHVIQYPVTKLNYC